MFKCLRHFIKRFTRIILLRRTVSYLVFFSIFPTSLKFSFNYRFENILKILSVALEVSLSVEAQQT